MARDSLPRLCNTYPNAASTVAITGLSYAAICQGCPSQYRTLQISPQIPDTSPCPQQPTRRGGVVPFRAPLRRDFHPFIHNRVRHVAMPPVSVSPNPRNSGPWIGSKRGVAPLSALRLPRQLHYEHAASAVTVARVGDPHNSAWIGDPGLCAIQTHSVSRMKAKQISRVRVSANCRRFGSVGSDSSYLGCWVSGFSAFPPRWGRSSGFAVGGQLPRRFFKPSHAWPISAAVFQRQRWR